MPLKDYWWCILVAKYGAFLFTEIGVFLFTDYISFTRFNVVDFFLSEFKHLDS